jgi:AcrR family transcriptional regulator
VTKLSLRGAARLAGVSQTAPYRHFADKAALLAAVAAAGFRDLAHAMRRAASGTDREHVRLSAIGCAYLAFAIDNRAVFRLMFGPEIPDKAAHPDLRAAADEAFTVLADETSAITGTTDAAVAAWSFIHGFATLIIDGQIPSLGGAPIDPATLVKRFGRFLDFSKV